MSEKAARTKCGERPFPDGTARFSADLGQTRGETSAEPCDLSTIRPGLPGNSSGSCGVIRYARPDDAEAMHAVHTAAISAVSTQVYPPEIIHAWRNSVSSLGMRSYLADPGILFLVARRGSKTIGFGCLEGRHIRAVYVHPNHGRHGFGRTLLQALEEAARGNGCECVFLRASLNAAPFYLRNGYTDLGPGEFDLSADLSMPCRKMAKAM